MYPLPPSFPSFRNRLFRLSAVLFFTSDTGREVGQIGPFFPLIFHLCCPHFCLHFPFRPSRFLSPSPSPVFTLLLHGHEGESGPVGSHRPVFIPYFDLPIPRFPARLIPVSPPFPSFPASISCLPKNSPKNLVRFPKNLSVIPEKWLVYWLPKNLPFSQKLDDFPKNFPRFYFLGVFKGRRGGLEGLLQQFPLCFPSSV